jgi:hypothetical protein
MSFLWVRVRACSRVALALPAHIRLGFKDLSWTRSLFRTFVSYDRKKCNNIGPRTRLGLLKWHHDIQHYNKKETLSITTLDTRYCYAECRYAECYYYAECHYAECRWAESRGAVSTGGEKLEQENE